MRSYLTIKQAGNFEIDIKKSQFICNIARTETKEEAEEFITQIKKEHSSATHNCYAYVLGMDNEVMKQNDNGEPSGTAGAPILNVLEQLELRNVTAIVTRYFGGIKLGAGGLIRAYSNATSKAIEHIGVNQRQPQTESTLTIAYPLQGKLEHFLAKQQIQTVDTQYTDKVSLTIALNTTEYDEKVSLINDFLNAQVTITKGPVTITKGPEVYHEIPYDLTDKKARY